MDGDSIITDLNDLCESNSITKNELLGLLKRYIKNNISYFRITDYSDIFSNGNN